MCSQQITPAVFRSSYLRQRSQTWTVMYGPAPLWTGQTRWQGTENRCLRPKMRTYGMFTITSRKSASDTVVKECERPLARQVFLLDGTLMESKSFSRRDTGATYESIKNFSEFENLKFPPTSCYRWWSIIWFSIKLFVVCWFCSSTEKLFYFHSLYFLPFYP